MSHLLPQRTVAWHEARRGKITASNAGALLGLNPYTSRKLAYLRLLGQDTFTGNKATEHGNTNEANGIMAYSAHTGNLVMETGLHVHPDCQWLAGSPDGLIGNEGLLEVKCPFYRKKDGSRIHKEIPLYYYLQMHLCLEVTDRQWCDFMSWSHTAYRIYRIQRDKDLQSFLQPFYVQIAASAQRGADLPVIKPNDLCAIKQAVEKSAATHTNYAFWELVDLAAVPPTPLHSDSDEERPNKILKVN